MGVEPEHYVLAAYLILQTFSGEMALHFRGLQNINKPTVLVFSEVVVCLDRGTSQFAMPPADFEQLRSSRSPN